MKRDNIWQSAPTKTEFAPAIQSQEAKTLTTSTQFPNDELGPSRPSFNMDPRPYRRRGYFLRSPRRAFDRLKAAAIQFALITILIAGFVVAALFALDLSDMLKW
jgi:hypothetical protein